MDDKKQTIGRWARPAIYLVSVGGALGAYVAGFGSSGRPMVELVLAIACGLIVGTWVNWIATTNRGPRLAPPEAP